MCKRSVSQNAVVKIQKQALELGLAWRLDVSVTDGILKQKLFPKEHAASAKQMPDYEYAHKKPWWIGSNTTPTRLTSKRLIKNHDSSMRVLYGLKPEKSQS